MHKTNLEGENRKNTREFGNSAISQFGNFTIEELYNLAIILQVIAELANCQIG